MFNVGLTGLDAARAGLLSTQSNISNVNTQGYHRRDVVFGTNIPTYSGIGFLGAGVQVDEVRRIYSQFLDSEVLTTQSLNERYGNYSTHARTLDKLLGDTNSGLSGPINNFFSAANEVANSPTSTAARQSLISAGNGLATRFHSVQSHLASVQNAINDEVTVTVTQINNISSRIATLNRQISEFEAISQQPANDLIDTRSKLLEDLSKLVNVQVLDQGGQFNLLIGTGQALILGAAATTMTTVKDPNDPQNLLPALKTGSVTLPAMDENVISGGVLGGLLAFREEVLKPAQTAVDRMAYVLASQFNEIHNAGADLNGNLNVNFFSFSVNQAALNASNTTGVVNVTIPSANYTLLTDSAYVLSYDGANYTLTRQSDGASATGAIGAVTTIGGVNQGFTLAAGVPAPAAGDRWLVRPMNDAARTLDVAITQPSRVAAGSLGTSANSANTGTGSIGNISFSGPPYNTNLSQTVTLTFTAPGAFNVTGTGTGNPVGVVYTAPGPQTISYNGWSVTLSGAPAAGDVFTLAPGIGDNSIASKFANLQTSTSNIEGTMSYGGAYNKLVNYVASLASDAQISFDSQTSLLNDVRAQRDSVSGVNMDEEAAKLVQYQQAYQAAAKSIQMANSLFDELLNVLR
ncbi:MAG: flagellar hook-associated protein FlgK [Betaproteobacteria bacterium]|nr:flagellar hook-associated protein FlgK [Betaproteobacteria bacterium]